MLPVYDAQNSPRKLAGNRGCSLMVLSDLISPERFCKRPRLASYDTEVVPAFPDFRRSGCSDEASIAAQTAAVLRGCKASSKYPAVAFLPLRAARTVANSSSLVFVIEQCCC